MTDNWLAELADSSLMHSLRDICLKNCQVSHQGLKKLNWKRLENINIIGVSIRGEQTFYKTFTKIRIGFFYLNYFFLHAI